MQQIGSLFAKISADDSGFSGSMKRAKAQMNEAGSQAGRMGSSLGGVTKAALGLGLAYGGLKVGKALFVDPIASAGDFQQTMNVLNTVSGAGAANMKLLSARAIALGADVRLPATSAQDAASAMLELGKAGLKTRQILKATHGVLLLSAAGQIDNATAADMVSKALGAFNLKAKESNKVVDNFAGAANASQASLLDVGTAMTQAGQGFHALKVPIVDASTAIAEMAKGGIVGGMAGAALNVAMVKLADPTKKATALMKDMGVNLFDAHGKFVGMRGAIQQLSPKLDAMSNKQRLATLSILGGTRGMKALNIVLGGGVSQWDAMRKQVEKAGQAQQLANAQTEGFNGAMSGLTSTLQTIGITLGTRVLPKATEFLRFLSRVAGAKSFTVAIKIAWKGVASVAGDLKKAVNKALFGGKDQVTMTGSLRIGQQKVVTDPGLVAKIHTALDGMIARTDWSALGKRIGDGISKSISVSTNALNTMMSGMLAWVSANSGAIASVGVVIGLTMISKLLDPSFWAAHWQLIGGIALSAASVLLPEGKLAEIGVKGLAFLLKPFSKLGAKLASIGTDAVLSFAVAWAEGMGETAGKIALALGNALLKVTGLATSGAAKLGAGIVRAIINKIAGLGTLFRTAVFTAIVTAIGQLVSSLVGKAQSLGEKLGSGIKNSAVGGIVGLAGDLTGKIASAISQVAGWVVGEAESIGVAIMKGVVIGIATAPYNVGKAIVSKVGDGVSWAGHQLHGSGDFMFTKHVIGVPMAQGILEGFLLGSTPLPSTIAESVSNSLNAAKDVITARQGTLSTAFSQLGTDITAAFEASTSRGLDKIQAKFAKLTPSEKKLADLQSGHDEAGRQQAITDARTGLAAAQAGGDPQAILDAQTQLNSALYDEQVASLQAQADAERTAADKKSAKAQLNYQAARDLQKRHLDARLADLSTALAKDPILFQQQHKTLMKWLNGIAGPDLHASGKNLGLAFATGLAESVQAVNKAAHSLALELQQYLKLNSPAKKGPLASLDTWWTAMPKTLLSGVDGRELAGVAAGIAAPSGLGAALAATSGGGGTVIVHAPVTVQGSVITEQELFEKNRLHLISVARRNPSMFGTLLKANG